jgi:hypothetical protein
VTSDHLADTARWAEKARRALTCRDDAIRAAVAAGTSVRATARAAGLSAPAVDRIVERAGATNTRW